MLFTSLHGKPINWVSNNGFSSSSNPDASSLSGSPSISLYWVSSTVTRKFVDPYRHTSCSYWCMPLSNSNGYRWMGGSDFCSLSNLDFLHQSSGSIPQLTPHALVILCSLDDYFDGFGCAINSKTYIHPAWKWFMLHFLCIPSADHDWLPHCVSFFWYGSLRCDISSYHVPQSIKLFEIQNILLDVRRQDGTYIKVIP